MLEQNFFNPSKGESKCYKGARHIACLALGFCGNPFQPKELIIETMPPRFSYKSRRRLAHQFPCCLLFQSSLVS